MDEIKQLIEDYKNKIIILKTNPTMDIITRNRYDIKSSCYRTFIVELKRILNNKQDETK